MQDHQERYSVIKKASIRPNKIVFYNQFIKRNIDDSEKPIYTNDERRELASIGIISMPTSNVHDMILSDKAKKRIQEKVMWLNQFATCRTITTISGKKLRNFKLNFITLTLPSKQMHPTKDITNTVLNQFITELKQKKQLQNYVWKMEFQKNGNAHYHIVTDAFIDYWYLKRVWNRCLEKLNYISEYSNKFKNMKFSTYYSLYKNEHNTFEKLKEQFIASKKTNFSQPNTVDVKAVTDEKNIASYIAKYITKNEKSKITEAIKERETTTNFRLWFCSRELSKLDKIEVFMDCISDDVQSFLESLQKTKTYIFDYVEMIFYNEKEQTHFNNHHSRKIFEEYRRECSYTNQ